MSSHATPVSPLRQRIIDDMTLRKLGPRTQTAYIRADPVSTAAAPSRRSSWSRGSAGIAPCRTACHGPQGLSRSRST